VKLPLPLARAARALRQESLGPGGDLRARPEARPIDRPGRTPAVLCLHGFGGVPAEVAPCVEVATELGLAVRAPLLPGHGRTPADLAPLRFEDWLAGARAEFDALRREGPVILVGLSLGSLLATRLTLDAPGDVRGLVLLANAFWLARPFPADGLELVDRVGLPDFGFPKLATDIGDPKARAAHVSYDVQPARAALSVLRAGEALRQELFRVHCPTLVLHGARDRVTPVSNAWRVAGALGAADRRVVIFPASHHILPCDRERAAVAAELRTFFGRLSRLAEGDGGG
jgi:carboxylesterase